MTKEAKTRFLNKLGQIAEELYQTGDSFSYNGARALQKNYLWGYCNDGKTIELESAKEVQQAIDGAHMTVYGEIRAVRAECLSPIGDGSEVPDWDVFDEPTFERKRNSTSP